MATKEFTLQEVARHNTRKDIYVVIDEVVYDASTMIEDHPYVPSFFLPSSPEAMIAGRKKTGQRNPRS